MNKIILMAFVLIATNSFAQTAINKTYPVQAGQKVSFRFDYPNLVKVSTWEKNEISVQGTVSINSGENDDAFVLNQTTSGNTIMIRNEINNMKNLPHRITVVSNGKKITFPSRAEYRKYIDENGRQFSSTSEGVDMDIVLEIKVPKSMQTFVESVYGMVEVVNFNGPLVVDATYGGVDVTLQEANTGELKAETNYGQIYTNLAVKFTGSEFQDFHTVVSAKLGNGPAYDLESKYGNVYLRKPGQ